MTDTVNVSRELLRQVLEALEFFSSEMTVGQRYTNEGQTAIDAPMQLRTLLDAPVQEPVAEVVYLERGGNAGIATRIVEIDSPHRERLQAGTKLYTAPQVQQPVMLTPEQIEQHIGYRLPSHSMKLLLDLFAQQPRKAVKLSEEEKLDICRKQTNSRYVEHSYEALLRMSNAIEQAVWEKNGMTE